MLKDADSIIVLQHGKVVGHGPHQQLLHHCPLYQKMWQQQMEL
jgi:ATP-binding cassette subfamily B protein